MGTVFDSIKPTAIKTYVLGFDSYDGSAGRIGTPIKKVRKPKANGFENWIDKQADFAFVDFNKFTQQYPGASVNFFMKGQHHNTIQKAEWYKIYDGIFFIRHMYACQSVSKN
ncbi:MAG TPA: hypothetical protein VGI82_08465 [Chitinophagaceae bacterium]